jgi:hypothetical protein
MQLVKGVLELWVVNDAVKPARGVLTLSKVSNAGREPVRLWSQKIQILSNSGRRVAELRERTIGSLDPERECFLLEWDADRHKYRNENVLYLVPPKFFEAPAEPIRGKAKVKDGVACVELRSTVIQRGVVLHLQGSQEHAEFSDNWFDLYPGRPREITVPVPDRMNGTTFKAKCRVQSLNSTGRLNKVKW